jgi:hypothetical protein
MSTVPLETAAHPEQLRRVVIEPLSRPSIWRRLCWWWR